MEKKAANIADGHRKVTGERVNSAMSTAYQLTSNTRFQDNTSFNIITTSHLQLGFDQCYCFTNEEVLPSS